MIDFYFWPTPNGYKISIALEEFGLAYALKPVNILTGEQHDPAFVAISPNHRVPAIVDHEGPGGVPHAVFESGAIMLYLAQKTGLFWPSDAAQRSVVIQWLFFQNANIGPMFGQNGYFRGYADEQVEHAKVRYWNATHRLYGLVDRELAEKPWIAGAEYSLADMATYPWMVERQRLFHGIDIGEFPHVGEWLARVEARPAVQRGVALMRDAQRVGNPTAAAREAMFGRA